jgi:hypothetical protein
MPRALRRALVLDWLGVDLIFDVSRLSEAAAGDDQLDGPQPRPRACSPLAAA